MEGTYLLILSLFLWCDINVCSTYPNCYFDRRRNVLTLPKDCCLIDQQPVISRMEYAIFNNNDDISDSEYNGIVYPVIGTEELAHDVNITRHYFGKGREDAVLHKYVEIRKHNMNRYIICFKKNSSIAESFKWDYVEILSTCGSGQQFEKYLKLARNMKMLKLCHCPKKLDLNFPKLDELSVVIEDQNFRLHCLAQVSEKVCVPNPCGPNSECRDDSGIASCSCLPSYSGSPPNCKAECRVDHECSQDKVCYDQKCINPCLRDGICGQNALCSIDNHVTKCHCPQYFTGDPAIKCVPMEMQTQTQTQIMPMIPPLPTQPGIASNPCNPSPCGPNSKCEVGYNEQVKCSCLNNNVGVPPNCEVGCTDSSVCEETRICLNNKCTDPCPGVCGTNAECYVTYHKPICSCSEGYTGDAFTECIQLISSTPSYFQPDPCSGDICGPNSECKVLNNMPVCSCQQNYIGTPPNCRAECVNNTDCSSDKTCISQKCVDPCIGTCGVNAKCNVISHTPVCYCPEGTTGDPIQICFQAGNNSASDNDPCDPSPCGENSKCIITGDVANCSCLDGFNGEPPECQSECISVTDCKNSTVCINGKCKDPCPGVCGKNALCSVVNHRVQCTCPEQYTGEPFEMCSPVLSPIGSRSTMGEENDPCDPSPCGPNTRCIFKEVAFCSCLPSFVGSPPNCELACNKNIECPEKTVCRNHVCVNPCKDTCGLNAKCEVINHTPLCSCRHGHIGDPFNKCFPIPHINIHAPVLKKISLRRYSENNIGFSEETMKSVMEMELHENKIDLEELVYTLQKFTSLKLLNLSDSNEINNFPERNVRSLNSITTLDLSNCKLKNLDRRDSFSAFLSLQNINLTKNHIESVSPNIFNRISSINYINMSDSLKMNNLALNFSTRNKINYLDLSKNKLLYLNIAFSDGVNVLDLSENHLSHKTFLLSCGDDKSINQLKLQYNNIDLTQDLFEKLCDAEYVDLRGYNLHCTDCDFLKSKKLKAVLNNASNTEIIFDDQENFPKCTEPAKLAGKLINYDSIKHICPAKYTTTIIITAIPVVLVLILIIIMAGIAYKYRFEISYWIQYVKLKKRKMENCYCDPEGYEYDAFISYCSADRRWVWTVLRPGLENAAEKYRLCLHERDFLLGSAITENIERSMRTSRYCIMVLTNDFIASQWCRWEMELAGSKLVEERREFLILIELEPLDTSDIPPHLKLLISTRTYLEWNLEKFPEKSLLDRLKSALGQSIFEKNLELKLNNSELLESCM